MRTVYKKIFLTFLISFGIGGGAILLVASSSNGYVAGFVILPLFFLIAVASLFLFIVGFILLSSEEKSAPWVLLSAVLIPSCFIFSGLTAKYFEIGAYREEPMIPISNEVSNIVLFKEGTTNDQINDFWNKTMSIEREDGRGHDHLPGVRDMGSNQSRNGYKTIDFGFFPNATEEQKQFVFAKVKSSPIVYQLLENQSMKEWNSNSENSSPSSNSNSPLKKDVSKDSSSSR
jgi:hypothetical protein